jgi:hypothetical protein
MNGTNRRQKNYYIATVCNFAIVPNLKIELPGKHKACIYSNLYDLYICGFIIQALFLTCPLIGYMLLQHLNVPIYHLPDDESIRCTMLDKNRS